MYFCIAQSTLSLNLKFKYAISKPLSSGTSTKHKKFTQLAREDFENALYTWFLNMRMKKIPISGSVLQQKVLDYACMPDIGNSKASSE